MHYSSGFKARQMLSCFRAAALAAALLAPSLTVLFSLAYALLLTTFVWASDNSTSSLEISADPAGGYRAQAELHFAAPPEAIRAALTDYEHWPALFNGRFRVVQLRREKDRVLTDLMIRRSPLPGELRLYCETRELWGGVLVTTGLEGDFVRYVRRWKLEPEVRTEGAGPRTGTRAHMELSLELRTWVPDWLLVRNLRAELLEHFRILEDKALDSMKAAGTVKSFPAK
jgi:hypothetical protein